VVDRHEASDEGGIDWRRLATDRNVSPAVARALWERACATAPDDPMQAEHAFHDMLDEAEAANATHEPGRETLVDATPGTRDASSLGPGKWTRVLLEEQKPGGAAGSAKRGTQTPAERGKESGKPPSAEELRNKLVAAGQAGKNAAALLAASDPATIIEALRELRVSEGPGVLQTIMSVAGSAIERLLGQRLTDPQTQIGAEPDANPATAPLATTLAPAAAHGTPDPAAADRTPTANTPAANTPAANTPAANTPTANTPDPATANRAPTAGAPDRASAVVEVTRSSRSSRP
jgi:hypothetical protein